MFADSPTKTAETVALYLKKSRGLAKRARVDLALSDDAPLDARQFVAWLADLRPTLSKPSWRLYKSAAICYLEQNGAENEEALQAIDYLKEIDSEGCALNTNKTSSTKLKKFPWKDFQKITDYLRNHSGKWHRPLLDWIVSASLTGLRPQEWLAAKITVIAGEPALHVQNAKTTNGRAHGPSRTLLLGSLAREEVETLTRHIERAQRWSGMQQFDSFYDGCALTLNYVSRKLWPRRTKHVTLYSCRHQFTANAKASGFSTAEIAAMMGHAVDTTATRHYGKKAAGHEMLRVRAIEQDIENVQQKFQTREQKAINKQRAKEPQPKPRGLSDRERP